MCNCPSTTFDHSSRDRLEVLSDTNQYEQDDHMARPLTTARRLRSTHRTKPAWHTLFLLIFALFWTTGCSSLNIGRGGGSVSIISQGDQPTKLDTSFETAVYRYRGDNAVTILLSDLPQKDLETGAFTDGQVLCIDMFWRPTAGQTPMDTTTTNCSIREVIFTGSAVGVYGGAGYLRPNSKSVQKSFSGSIHDSTLKLINATPDFADRLGMSSLTSTFKAKRDDEAAARIAIQINSEVSRRMGELCFVVSD